MPDIVAGRAARRRVPEAEAWSRVAWSGPAPARGGAVPWTWIAASALAAIGVVAAARSALRTESVQAVEDAPVWVELPPRVEEPEARIPPPPPEPRREDPPVADRPPAPAPLAPSAEAPARPDPAFGLDDAVETGGLAVAAGASLAREPDPVVRADPAPSGPVPLQGVPAVVRAVVPRYPPRAEAMGLESKVVALVTTDTLGNVVEVGIERSGGRDFDASVRQAVLATRFVLPRGPDGRARAVAFRMPYEFRME